jgi:FkbM family methyltransferase
MRHFKRWFFQLLGQERYLLLISRLYFLAYHAGLLRRHADYQCHYFARRLINTGDVVVDIGANLGYYTVLFADWTGPGGQVWAVEPSPVYRAVLRRNLGARFWVRVLPYALGEQSGRARMGIAGAPAYRHGLTRVLEERETGPAAYQFEVEMRAPREAFDELPRLDYVKCDVEGYEMRVIPALRDWIRRLRPIWQIEVDAANRQALFDLFLGEEYLALCVVKGRARPLPGPDTPAQGDVFFVPREKWSW